MCTFTTTRRGAGFINNFVLALFPSDICLSQTKCGKKKHGPRNSRSEKRDKSNEIAVDITLGNRGVKIYNDKKVSSSLFSNRN